MPVHKIQVSLPNVPIVNSDVIIEIFQDEEKLGKITISKGSLEWYPVYAKKPYNLEWSRFDRMIKEFFNE